jgi:hypothetical protein
MITIEIHRWWLILTIRRKNKELIIVTGQNSKYHKYPSFFHIWEYLYNDPAQTDLITFSRTIWKS